MAMRFDAATRRPSLADAAYEAYERGGDVAVHAVARAHGIATWAMCGPCDAQQPVDDGACLVCGSAIVDTPTAEFAEAR